MISYLVLGFTLTVLVSALFFLTFAMWRIFVPGQKIYALDPVKVALWFSAVCMLNSMYIRMQNGVTTMVDFKGTYEYPLASFLVHLAYATVVVTVFLTEKAIQRARTS